MERDERRDERFNEEDRMKMFKKNIMSEFERREIQEN